MTDRPAADHLAPLTREDVMLGSETAELLRMSKSTLYYLAARGEVPGRRVGRSWRFARPDVEAWLRTPSVPPRSRGRGSPEDVPRPVRDHRSPGD
jgi:excisionase family DNA binding protein